MAASKGITWEAFKGCARQSDIARLLGKPGKSTRDVSRRVFGLYVSQGGVLDDGMRAILFAYHVLFAGDADARIALVNAYKGPGSIDRAALVATLDAGEVPTFGA